MFLYIVIGNYAVVLHIQTVNSLAMALQYQHLYHITVSLKYCNLLVRLYATYALITIVYFPFTVQSTVDKMGNIQKD